jgi:UDP-N-acetylglucosamine 4,6-dehydratase
MNFLKNKKILITGGTGSLGKALIRNLEKSSCDMACFSRDEGKQALLFADNPSVNCIIGDIRDYDKLYWAFRTFRPDYVIHAAALKRIDDMEIHPDECIKTNILGSQNVLNACLNARVKKCILISTDKACEPINVYGSTKFIAERLFSHSDYSSVECAFSSIRYGNVIASRGSFIPLFLEWIKAGKQIRLTSEKMTRFLFTLDDAATAVLLALQHSQGGEVFVPKINSYTIPHCILALGALTGKTPTTSIIGLRPGEKLHEDMLSTSELDFTYEVPHSNLLQIRPHRAARKYQDFPQYTGPPLNSSLWAADDEESINELIPLFERGLEN